MRERRPETFKPGKSGLSYFENLLNKGPKSWRLETLRFCSAGIEFSLVKGPHRLELEAVHPGRDKRPCLFAGRRLGLRLRNAPSPEERKAAGSVYSALSGTTFIELLTKLMADALFYSDPEGPALPSRLDRFYRLADHSKDWWKFFFPKECFLEQEVRFGGKHVKLHHATKECRASNPQASLPSLRLFADERVPRPGSDCLEIETDLGEQEVVGGKTLKVLSDALRRAAADHHADSIHLMTTCLPELIGDDPRPIISGLEKEFKIPIIWTAKTGDSGPGFMGLIGRMLDRINFSSKRNPKAVILAGVLSPEERLEAERLLGLLGLRVVGCLFPDLSGAAMSGIGRANSVVWVNPVGWRKIGDEHFIENGLSAVRHHPPFGIEGTRAWLARVGSVLGTGAFSLKGLTAGRGSDLKALRADCRKRTVALIGDRDDVAALVNRGRNLGFSVASLLCEMGFSLKTLVYHEGRASDIRRPPSPVGPGKIEFIPFRTRHGLEALLRSGIDLAFTHFNQDPRLSAAGIAGFCEDAFETGVSGFISSARRLLRLCETAPFQGNLSLRRLSQR